MRTYLDEVVYNAAGNAVTAQIDSPRDKDLTRCVRIDEQDVIERRQQDLDGRVRAAIGDCVRRRLRDEG